jgi:GxxExxY protein
MAMWLSREDRRFCEGERIAARDGLCFIGCSVLRTWHAGGMYQGMPTRFSIQRVNAITSTIIARAIRIHRALGPGLLESAYAACLRHELASAALRCEIQPPVPLVYEGLRIDCAYRADMIVEGVVLVEAKAVDAIAPVHVRQLRTYTRLAECAVGLLLNFGAPTMKEGIRRVINGFPDDTVSDPLPEPQQD